MMADNEEQNPTPFSVLLSLFNARLALQIPAFWTVPLEEQCAYLQSKHIDTKSSRKQLIDTLIEKQKSSKDANFNELSSKSYIRIRFKYILSQFHKESIFLRTSTDIESWNTNQMILSFITHLIDASVVDESVDKKNTASAKIWEFVDYLRKYFIDEQYDGARFISSFDANADKPTKGFGLKFTKTVCNKYNLKSGPFSKVKKQCNVWSTKLYNQSRGELPPLVPVKAKQAEKPAAKPVIPPKPTHIPHPPPNYSKFVTDVSMFSSAGSFASMPPPSQAQQQQQNKDDSMAGMKWYWFNDMDGALKWTPYRDEDQKKLMQAFNQGSDAAMIVNDTYRVEFNRNNPNQPGGNQYNAKIQNPGGRTVVCSKAKDEIHGVPITNDP